MRVTILLLCLAVGCAAPPPTETPSIAPGAISPSAYLCVRADAAPEIDGRLEDPCWDGVPWTEAFVDIVDYLGDSAPPPRHATRAKMTWDDDCLYIGAELEEPHVQATLTERDSVIFQDNDFEVFIDPDGDTHAYYELEINAYGTEWDLFLVKPYRDGGPPLDGWDIAGLRTAVHVDGTVDDPSDVDRGWTVEIAIPWAALADAAGCPTPPRSGDLWRVNFSRVEWRTEVVDGAYQKALDPDTGEPFAEDNWVWSPQGVVNMHCPEAWGVVLFSDSASWAWPRGFVEELRARYAMRQIYHAEWTWREAHGAFTDDLAALEIHIRPDVGDFQWPPRITCTESFFEAVLPHLQGRNLRIAHDGRIWVERP